MSGLPHRAALLPLLFISASQGPGPQAAARLLDRCTLEPQPVATTTLPVYLTEVSGLAGTAEGRLLAHGDESGRIAELDPATLEIVREFRLRNTPRDDFEGIAVTPEGIVMMTSRGELYLVGDKGAEDRKAGKEEEGVRDEYPDEYPFERLNTGFGRRCELEGLAWDADARVLLLPCKRALDPRLVNAFVVFRWSLERRAPADPAQILASRSAVARLVRTTQFRATSVQWDSTTGHLLVLSSHPAVIVELAPDGSLVGGVALDARRHPQAEGLTLIGDRLLIADEGADRRRGTITAYRCAP